MTMISAEADRLRNDFLARLDVAMRDLPHGVAAEIRTGIAEELTGLDVDAVASRIALLGDPLVIAREAQVEVPGPPVTIVAALEPARRPVTSTRGYAIAAALTLSFGVYAVPLLGWVVGAILVCFSSLWRTWEKVVAIATPVAVVLMVGLLVLSAYMTGSIGDPVPVDQVSGIAGTVDTANPLLPTSYDMVWSGAMMIGILLIPSGLWLLWRLRGRAPR